MTGLRAKWAEGKFLCVGLDSDLNNAKFPAVVPIHWYAEKYVGKFSEDGLRQLSYNCWVVDMTKDIACAYKPNLAFYKGDEGKRALKLTFAYIGLVATDVLTLLDAKQGDIDNTNNGYVEDDFDYYLADAVTVHNYLGMVAMKPFLDRADKGVIVLCRTSNTGAGEFQDVRCLILRDEATGCHYSTEAEAKREGVDIDTTSFAEEPMTLYQFVAYRVKEKWNYNGNCAVVAGATYDEDVAKVRQIIGTSLPTLLPGIGAQGGKVTPTVHAGRDENNEGMIINSSRDIIFPWDKGAEFNPDAIRDAAQRTHSNITAALAS